MMDAETKRSVHKRIRRIAGQGGGIERMIAEDRYCVDVLQQITAALGEVAYLSVLDGWELVFIPRTSTSRPMSTGFVLGARVPAPLASAGVMMLASQPEEKVREMLDLLGRRLLRKKSPEKEPKK